MACRGLVLLAEDDAAQREVLRELLEFEGYRTVAASGPNEVVEALRDAPDAVLLDLRGVATPPVLNALRRSERPPRVLLVSGEPGLDRIAEVLGVDGFLTKPYGVEELLSALERAMQAPRLRQDGEPAAGVVCS